MKVCRICLSKDGRLYPITSNGLRLLYHQLTGLLKLEMDIDARLPQWVCAECGLRLLSYNKLRQKSLRAHQILTDLLDEVTHITKENLDQIDRERNNLKSNLSYAVRDTLQEYNIKDSEVDIQKTEIPEDNLKITEFALKLEADDGLKTHEDSSIECNSETDVSISKIDSDSESDYLSDLEYNTSDSSSTVKKILISLTPKSLKTKQKNAHLDIKNSVDITLNKKTTKRATKNEVKKRVNKMEEVQKSNKKDEVLKRVNKKEKVQKRVKTKEEGHKKNKTKKEVKKDDPFVDVFNIQILSLEEQIMEFEKRKYSPKYIKAKFQCDLCLKGFTAEGTFDRHKLMHTIDWGKYECNICKTRFRTISYYGKHMKAHKTIYSCKECNFKAADRTMAQLHRLKHKGKVYECPHCCLEFVNKNAYMLHIRVKHVSQFVCDYCGFSFVSTKGVELHKKLKHIHEIETQIVSADSPACATCDIKFVSDEALNTHIGVAHPQNPDSSKRNDKYRIRKCGETKVYPCRVCGKELTPRNKSRHMLIHTDLRPFLCETCGKSFRTKAEVKLHTTHVHLKVPWPRKEELETGASRRRRRGNKKSVD